MKFNHDGVDYEVMEVIAQEIVEGNRWVNKIVEVGSWREIFQNNVEGNLVMMENPDSIMIAKCQALGVGGLVFKNDVKMEVWTTKILVDEIGWDVLRKEASKVEKVWVDENESRLLLVLK